MLAAGGFSLPVFVAVALSSLPGFGFLMPLCVLLPVFCIAAIVINARGVGDKPSSIQLLTLVIIVWNGILAALYTMRCLHELMHLDLGTYGGGLLSALALTQTNVGWQAAETVPVFLYLPLVVPELPDRSRLPLSFASLGGFLASAMIALFGVAIPTGIGLAAGKRGERTVSELGMRRDMEFSLAIGDGRLRPLPDLPAVVRILGNTADWPTRIARAKELGLDAIDIPVEADVARDEPRFQRLAQIAKQVRSAGLGLNLIVQTPGRRSSRMHHTKFEDLMLEAQWLFCERLEPDLLVLFSRPFGRRTVDVVGELPVGHWRKLITKAIQAIKKGQPEQRTAIELEPPNTKAAELFASICDPRGPSEIRFVVEGDRAGGPTIGRVMLELSGWLASHPTRTRLGIVASPPAPLSLGGLKAQSAYLRKVVAFAAGQPLITTVSAGPMIDTRDGLNGFWDNRDKPRPVVAELFGMLRELRGLTAPPAPK